ncbi:MAG TPA: DCC1-like thiol-disulfide oxidoreductase family protein [Kofleriaceae bacterium]|nr:DCC1-like thiol-disulfide oxidoreductase family protein [Kofleriaceae bacterium]
MSAAPPVVLFDGTCGMCSRLVFWILRHEADAALRFAPLQGATAAAARARHPNIPTTLESFVLVSDGRAYLRSQAAFRLARHLRAPWRWASALRVLPAFLFDPLYRLVAAVRYRIFGHADACALATPAQRARFLP